LEKACFKEMVAKKIIFSGTSMIPCLRPGDIVHVRETPWHELRRGDLVGIVSGGMATPIIHRLIGWQRHKGSYFGVLKGDSLTYTDHFLLTPNNYAYRVWGRERNGKLVLLDGFCSKIRARLTAFISIWNLTPGVLRLRIKRYIESIVPRVPGIKLLERALLKKIQYFFFCGQGNMKRLRAVHRGRVVGEITFQDCSLKEINSVVFSVYSLVVSPENLTAHAVDRFPDLFDQAF